MLCGGSIGLQADTVTLASGMPLEFPAPPSLQILAIARYRCGLRLVWHENPSLSFVPSRMKHYTSASTKPTAAPIDVAVGILMRPNGDVLLGQRPSGKPYAGYWEFPGGKVERGESI